MKAQLDLIGRAFAICRAGGNDHLERASLTVAFVKRMIDEISAQFRMQGMAESAEVSAILAKELDAAHMDLARQRAEDRQIAALTALALRPVEGRA